MPGAGPRIVLPRYSAAHSLMEPAGAGARAAQGTGVRGGGGVAGAGAAEAGGPRAHHRVGVCACACVWVCLARIFSVYEHEGVCMCIFFV